MAYNTESENSNMLNKKVIKKAYGRKENEFNGFKNLKKTKSDQKQLISYNKM